MLEREALQEWRRWWPMVLACLAGCAATGISTFPLAVLLKPLQAEYGWSRAQISLTTPIVSIMSLPLATFMGTLLDRWGGPRRLALVGLPWLVVAASLTAFAPPELWRWYGVWVLIALGVQFLLPLVWAAAIVRAFKASRGLALGVALSGGGASAAIYAPLSLWLLENFGVRAVYPGLAAVLLLVVGPLLLFAFKPPQLGLPSEKGGEPAEWGLSLRQAIRTRLFWLIVLIFGGFGVAYSAMNLHLLPMLTDKGLSAAQAASIVAVMGPSILVGRWAGGALLDRFPAKWIMLSALLIPAAGLLVLLDARGDFVISLVAAAMFAVSAGVEGDLLPFVLSRYFGPRAFGAIYGLGVAVFGAGNAIGPIGGGLLFDAVGSYDPGLIGMAILLAVGALASLTLGPYPEPSKATAEITTGCATAAEAAT
jgi:MFS transporter, OFA family, oxalate/formate antiporter